LFLFQSKGYSIRSYSTDPAPKSPKISFVPIKSYSNAEADKDQILKENKNKSGIYMWTNNINKKKYIGSAENLRRRFREYFNINHLIRYNCMQICRALIKHEYSKFSLTILEYCEREKLLIREKHYWNIFNPEYNIAQDPTAPMSGRKHSDATKIIMSDAKKGQKGKNHTEETKKKISDALVGNTNSQNQPNSQAIEVTDIKNNTINSYDSIREAARALNIHYTSIVKYFSQNQKNPYKGQYTFKKKS